MPKNAQSTNQKDTDQDSPKMTMKMKTNSKSRWFFITLLKLCFALMFVLGLCTIYLDAKVRQKFEGQRWQVPVQVYGHIEVLELGSTIHLKHIAESLKLNGYKKVRRVTHAGQFALSASRLVLYRRAFDFGAGLSPASLITIDVNNALDNQQKVTQLWVEIDDEAQSVSQVKLEPILLDRIVPSNKEDRVLVALEQVPAKLIDTLLLVEDRDFYHHSGVSPLGILRALYNNFRAGRTVQGGSTLTQQLVKNMFLTRERTISRKVKEALMALILEYRYSKDQLLEAYINEVYLGQNYGNGIYGFGLAAKFYFGKNLSALNDQQIALLVAQIKGPSYYDPWRYPERARKRRSVVLRLMFEKLLLSPKTFEKAMVSDLSIRKQRRLIKQKYPAYIQLVKTELAKHLSLEQQQTGIRVFTGFSHRSQQLLEQTVSKQLPILEMALAKKEKRAIQKNLQAAMIVTDIHSAEIRALSGSRESGYAGFNRALYAKRPVGSLLKPAIYLAALERYEQYNLATVLADKPIVLASNSGTEWRPKNYDGKYRQQVPLIEGLVKSLNVPTVNLGMKLGLDNVAQAMHLLGYQSKIVTRPSMLLGAINMSPLEINQLYLPIAGQGEYLPSHAITHIFSAQGETLWQFNQPSEARLSQNGHYLINYALHEVTKTGTARSLRWRLKDKYLSGKTGTSNELRDSWFIGYDGKNLVTSWIGLDNNQPTGLTGSSGALVLFADFMKKQGVIEQELAVPESISSTLFENETGNAVTNKCAGTTSYPAVAAGVVIQKDCLKEKVDTRSWFEKLFG